MGSRALLVALLVLSMVVAFPSNRNVAEVFGDDNQTTVTGILGINYPADYPASYYLTDNLGEVQLIPTAADLGSLYMYEGATIEATGNLVSENGQRILYMESWVLAEVSVAGGNPPWDPITVTGTQRLLVILATFSDITPHHTDTSYFQDMIDQPATDGPSMNDYFKEDSYGMITVTGTVTNWYTLQKSSTEYDVFTWQSCRDGKVGQLGEEIIKLVDADPNVNFALYNRFMVVSTRNSAGYGVWGCRTSKSVDTNHGTINGFAIVNEDSLLQTYMHEFSHDLGLPDLYDYSCSSTPPSPTCSPYDFIDGWDLQSHEHKQHHSAFSKMRLSWIPSQKVANFDLAAVNSAPGGRLEATFTIDRIATQTSGFHALRIGSNPQSSHKYFLVETRQKINYDVNIPDSSTSHSPDHGLLITYVDRDKDSGKGIVNLVDPYGGSTDQKPTTQGGEDGDAVWQVGQTYVNSYYGFAVAIQSWTGTGFVVKVTAPHVLYAVNFAAHNEQGADLPPNPDGLPDARPTVDYQISTEPVTVGQGTAPFSLWLEPGVTVSFSYRTTVYATDSVHYEFLDDNHDGQLVVYDWGGETCAFPPAPPPPACWDQTVVGSYKTSYHVVFQDAGVGSDFTDVPGSVVVTVDGTGFVHSGFWWDDRSTHSFSFESPLTVTENAKQYVWDSTNGLSTLQADPNFTVTGAGTITGNYRTQYYLTLQTQPTGVGGTIQGEGWHYSGTSSQLNAPRGPFRGPSKGGTLSVCGEDYYFNYWDVDGQRRDSPLTGLPSNPITVSMNGPHTATAHYSACGLLLTSGPTVIPINTLGRWTASLTVTASGDLRNVVLRGNFNPLARIVSICVSGICSPPTPPSLRSSPAGGYGTAAADLSPTVLGSIPVIFAWPSMPAGTSHTLNVTMEGSFSYPGAVYLTRDWSVTADSQSGPITQTIDGLAVGVTEPDPTSFLARGTDGVELSVKVIVDWNYLRPQTTPFSIASMGRHTFTVPRTVSAGGVTYNFVRWEDEESVVVSTSPTFTYTLQSTKTFTAVYAKPSYKLTVNVLDSSTHKPLAGATVTLDGVKVGTTDAYGRVVIQGVTAGNLQLVIHKTGYKDYTATINITSNRTLYANLNKT